MKKLCSAVMALSVLFTSGSIAGVNAADSTKKPNLPVKNYLYYKDLDPLQYKKELEEWYKRYMKETLDLENPQNYNQKIQWLKFYDSIPIKTKLADKYLVREYIKETIGEEYLVPIYGAWDNFEQIDFDKLPDKFVLKCNHGSGWNVIVKDKSTFNKEEAKKKFDVWMNKNFAFCAGFELHYKNIKPKIIAEKYIEGEMKDYRVLCFGGEPKYVWADRDVVNSRKHSRNIYDTNWNLIPLTVTYPNTQEKVEKPEYWNKLLELSKKLCKDFAHIRIDFFEVDGKLYFSELTFTPHSGMARFSDPEYNKIFGDLIKLPKEKYFFN